MKFLLTILLFALLSIPLLSQEISFIENNGFSKEEWKYVVRHSKASIYFYDSYFVIQTIQKIDDSVFVENIPIYFENKNAFISVSENSQTATKTYRYSESTIPSISSQYESIVYKNVKNNVDCRFFIWDNTLRFDFVVSDKSVTLISLKTSPDSKFLIANNQISLTTVNKNSVVLKDITLLESKNTTLQYQVSKSKNELIFTLKNNSDFAIIDPTFSFASLLGGASSEYIYDVKITDNNKLYAVGYTTSLDFPTTIGSYKTATNNADVFVYAIDLVSNTVLFSTFIGGTNSETGYGIDVTPSSVIICGQTNSLNFPVTPGAFSTVFNGGSQDGFVAGLSLMGNTLQFASYIGGSDIDQLSKVAVNNQGDIVTCGFSRSTNFPIGSNPFQFLKSGGNDAVIVTLSPTAASLFGGTFLGGSNDDKISNLSISSTNDIVVIGTTASLNFPLQQPMYSVYNGGLSDAFVSRFTPNLSNLIFSTYFGGNSNDIGTSVSFDSQNNIIIGGTTNSNNLPLVNEFFSVNQGGNDVFIAKILPNRTLDFSTYYGGKTNDNLEDLEVNLAGNIYITGFTNSNNLPLTTDALYPIYKGSGDIFISKLYKSGQSILYSSYYGDIFQDVSTSLSINTAGTIALGGYTQSNSIKTINAIDSTYNGGLFDALLLTLFLPDVSTSITTDSVKESYCRGVYDSVSFSFQGGFDRNNTFFVEISDSIGSFSNSRVLGALQSPNPKKISLFIPFDLPYGNLYKIRVRSTSPVVIGTATQHTIRVNINPIVNAGLDTVICKGFSVELGKELTDFPTIHWFSTDTLTSNIPLKNIVVSPTKTTKYWVRVVDSNGCSATDSIQISVQNPPISFVQKNISKCKFDTILITIPDSLTIFSVEPIGSASIVGDSVIKIYSEINQTISFTILNINNGCNLKDTLNISISDPEQIIFSKEEIIFPEKQECEKYVIEYINLTTSSINPVLIDSVEFGDNSFSFDSLQQKTTLKGVLISKTSPLILPVYFLGNSNTNSKIRVFSSKCVSTDSIIISASVDLNSVFVQPIVSITTELNCSNNITNNIYSIFLNNNTNSRKIITIDTVNISTIKFLKLNYTLDSKDSILLLFEIKDSKISSSDTITILISDSICNKDYRIILTNNVVDKRNEYSFRDFKIDTSLCVVDTIFLNIPIEKVLRNIEKIDTLVLLNLPNTVSLNSNNSTLNLLSLKDVNSIQLSILTKNNIDTSYIITGVLLPCFDTITIALNIRILQNNPNLFINSKSSYITTTDTIIYRIIFDTLYIADLKSLNISTLGINNISFYQDSINSIRIPISRVNLNSMDTLFFTWGGSCNFIHSIPFTSNKDHIIYMLDSKSALPGDTVQYNLSSFLTSSKGTFVDTISISTNKYLLYPLDFSPKFINNQVIFSFPITVLNSTNSIKSIRFLALLGDTSFAHLTISSKGQISTNYSNGTFTSLPVCTEKEVLITEVIKYISILIYFDNDSQKHIYPVSSNTDIIQFEMYTMLGQKIPLKSIDVNNNEYSIQPLISNISRCFLIVRTPFSSYLLPIYR